MSLLKKNLPLQKVKNRQFVQLLNAKRTLLKKRGFLQFNIWSVFVKFFQTLKKCFKNLKSDIKQNLSMRFKIYAVFK